LAEPDGPEVVLVSRLRGGGWLEESTMGALRARMLRALRTADRYGRLRAYYPDHTGLGEQCINLHSKLMVVDDRFAQVGSANLNNRSLGYDTECDLAVETSEPRVERAIALLRDRLLAEHLDVTPEQVAGALAERGSLIGMIEALRGSTRTLTPLDPDAAPQEDTLILDPSIVDPERPVDPDRLAAQFVPRRSRPVAARRVASAVVVLLAAAGLAAAWRWTPLHELLDAKSWPPTSGLARPFAPLLVLGAYVLASLTAFPITLLILATGLVFGPIAALVRAGGARCWVRQPVSGWDACWRATVRRLSARASPRSAGLGKQGLLAVIALHSSIAPSPWSTSQPGCASPVRDFMFGRFWACPESCGDILGPGAATLPSRPPRA
jgi:hypothetical protein